MKKLMIAAAAAAMIGAAEANTQVYQMQLNMLTTTCASGAIGANQNPFRLAAGNINFRTPASRQILGLIWMCECDYLVDLGWDVNQNSLGGPIDTWRYYSCAMEPGYHTTVGNAHGFVGTEGYIFWDATTGEPFFYNPTKAVANNPATWTVAATDMMPTFQWSFINRMGAYAEQVEGLWTIQDLNTAAYNLVGAGFGSMLQVTVPDDACDNIIAQMSGNFAGYVWPTNIGNTCIFCGNNGANCLIWPFCNCNEGLRYTTAGAPSAVTGVPANSTVAYGTWALWYDAASSAELINHVSIREFYPFSAETARMVQFLELNRR